jgi:3-oxoacyl-[acyl-carrier protein] reductase
MDLQLKGKVALVTGASRGLGFATASTLAREGCRVAVNSRSEGNANAAAEKIVSESGAQAIGLAGDVSEVGVAEQLVEETVNAFGGLDLLVTNAGGPPAGTFESFDEEAWQKAIDLSFTSHVRLIRAALPHLRKSQFPVS